MKVILRPHVRHNTDNYVCHKCMDEGCLHHSDSSYKQLRSKKAMTPHYKLISPSVSADGVRMIKSGYDSTSHCFKDNNAADEQKIEGHAKMNKSKSHLRWRTGLSTFLLSFCGSAVTDTCLQWRNFRFERTNLWSFI